MGSISYVDLCLSQKKVYFCISYLWGNPACNCCAILEMKKAFLSLLFQKQTIEWEIAVAERRSALLLTALISLLHTHTELKQKSWTHGTSTKLFLGNVDSYMIQCIGTWHLSCSAALSTSKLLLSVWEILPLV